MASHINHKRGYAKLQPKTQEDLDAEKALADFEAGKYGPAVPDKPEVKPVPPVVEEDPLIAEELKRKKGYMKLLGK